MRLIVLVLLVKDLLKVDSVFFFAQLRVSELSLKRQCLHYIY